jgi:hypothetical protein
VWKAKGLTTVQAALSAVQFNFSFLRGLEKNQRR